MARLLILNRQGPDRAPLSRWLGEDALRDAVMFTVPARVDQFSGLREVRAFEPYAGNGNIEREALSLHRDWPFDRIVATSEDDILRAGRLRSHLGLEGQSGESALAFRDKVVMKQLIRAGSTVRVPEFARLVEPMDLLAFVEEHGLPVVVKPVDGSGSFGAEVVRDEDDLADLLGRGVPLGYEVETFVEGAFFHVDALLHHGELVFVWPSKYTGDGLSHGLDGYNASVMLDREDARWEVLVEATRASLAALPQPPLAAVHLEFFLPPDGVPVFCEVASRTGGAMINPMLEQAFGFDLNQTFVQGMAGLPVDLESIRALGAQPKRRMGRGLIPPVAGTISHIHEPETAPGVVDFSWKAQPGDTFDSPADSAEAIGGVIVDLSGVADGEAELVSTLHRLEQCVVWEADAARDRWSRW